MTETKSLLGFVKWFSLLVGDAALGRLLIDPPMTTLVFGVEVAGADQPPQVGVVIASEGRGFDSDNPVSQKIRLKAENRLAELEAIWLPKLTSVCSRSGFIEWSADGRRVEGRSCKNPF